MIACHHPIQPCFRKEQGQNNTSDYNFMTPSYYGHLLKLADDGLVCFPTRNTFLFFCFDFMVVITKFYYNCVLHNYNKTLYMQFFGAISYCIVWFFFFFSSISLEFLNEDDFLDMNRLNVLYLRNNSLQSVSGAFTQLKYLSTLDLAMNNLTTLTTDSFPSFWNTSMRFKVLWMAGKFFFSIFFFKFKQGGGWQGEGKLEMKLTYLA